MLLLAPLSNIAFGETKKPTVAFYYNDHLPLNELQMYDWVILQSSMAAPEDARYLREQGTKPIAYLSIGEVSKAAAEYRLVDPSWFIGENTLWKSQILDWRMPEVQDFLIETLAAKSWNAGYQGFFLDTLDSFQATPLGAATPMVFNQALATLIRKMKTRFPGAIIIVNRGFDALPDVHKLIDAVAVESLYSSFDVSANRYPEVAGKDTEWLLGKLATIKQSYELPIIVIDYALPQDKERRNSTVTRIQKAGYIPWVSDGHLSTLGKGTDEVINRTILGIHDSPVDEIESSGFHRYIVMPLEQMGYLAEYSSILNLPNLDDISHIRGITLYLERSLVNAPVLDKVCEWLAAANATYQIPVLFVDIIPEYPACLKLAGAQKSESIGTIKVRETKQGYGEYQGRLTLSPNDPPDITLVDQDANFLVEMIDAKGTIFHPIAITSTGGFAVYPFLFERGFEDNRFWLIDPFEFLPLALNLPTIPTFDVTTESGRRILTSHIDGDGFVSRAEQQGIAADDAKLSGQVMMDDILMRYKIPHTVSIIQGEISKLGKYPHLAEEAEPIAREIFSLPWVELATHTFSHPFFWKYFENKTDVKSLGYGFHMDIPGYQPDLKKEIGGSSRYINTTLAPSNKKVEVLLWSGDALPGKVAMELASQHDLLNVNGGDTKVVNSNNSLAYIWPIGKPIGKHYQIYAPVMNENRYTNLWKGPFYGFRKVIETFELLEKPRRLKPISIYYHFYSASKISGLNALNDVYRWALAQQTTQMYLSDYAKRATEFFKTGLSRIDDSTWEIKRAGLLNTLRVDSELGQPNIEKSNNVIGYKRVDNHYYIHLHPGKIARLNLNSNETSDTPYLWDANAIIRNWSLKPSHDDHWSLSISAVGGEALEINVANLTHCQIVKGERKFSQKVLVNKPLSMNNSVLQMRFTKKELSGLELDCS
ncbi:hypothetical protein A9Q99_00460 [Gammaproteobacteria bacterium 45_16_T64]|nr:hypothetical protein A9Q99_00460 [Gammaproteobacteria bacterium 45_16_T64]